MSAFTKPLPAPPPGFTYSNLQPDVIDVDQPREFVLLTYHTSGPTGGGYEEEAAGWRAAAEEHGYGGQLVILDGGGRTSWREATTRKARAIHWALLAFGVPVVWIDADGRIRSRLTLFERWGGGTLGIRLRPINMAHPDRVFWCSGTLYFAANPVGKGLARAWAAECKKETDADSDQEVLGMLACAWAPHDLSLIRDLPPEYYWFDKDRERHPNAVPVIEHSHASRTRSGGRVDGWRFYEAPANSLPAVLPS